MSEPRIQFKNLNGFPPVDQRVETKAFLDAATEIVAIIESFGKLFKPVVSDMNGNITKLTQTFDKNQSKCSYLDDLIICEGNVNAFAADALLWLKRGLQLILIFFENIFYDAKQSDVLKVHLQDAYDRTLKPYHGFLVQGTIKLIYNWVPTRTQLIGQGADASENLKVLETYLPTMRFHLDKIDAFLKHNKLDDTAKA